MGWFTNNKFISVVSDGNGNEQFSRIGNGSYSIQSNVTHIGSTSITGDGRIISINGDQFMCGTKSYTKLGNTLVRSDGKTWSSFSKLSDRDVTEIIAHDK